MANPPTNFAGALTILFSSCWFQNRKAAWMGWERVVVESNGPVAGNARWVVAAPHAFVTGTVDESNQHPEAHCLREVRSWVESDAGASELAAEICQILGVNNFLVPRYSRAELDLNRASGNGKRGFDSPLVGGRAVSERVHSALRPKLEEAWTAARRELSREVGVRKRPVLVMIHSYDTFSRPSRGEAARCGHIHGRAGGPSRRAVARLLSAGPRQGGSAFYPRGAHLEVAPKFREKRPVLRGGATLWRVSHGGSHRAEGRRRSMAPLRLEDTQGRVGGTV